MATAVRICKVCRKPFPANQRRKTCSSECADKLKETKAEVKPEPVKRERRGGVPPWDPSPDQIQEQCRLIRAGLLVIGGPGKVTRVPPAS